MCIYANSAELHSWAQCFSVQTLSVNVFASVSLHTSLNEVKPDSNFYLYIRLSHSDLGPGLIGQILRCWRSSVVRAKTSKRSLLIGRQRLLKVAHSLTKWSSGDDRRVLGGLCLMSCMCLCVCLQSRTAQRCGWWCSWCACRWWLSPSSSSSSSAPWDTTAACRAPRVRDGAARCISTPIKPLPLLISQHCQRLDMSSVM